MSPDPAAAPHVTLEGVLEREIFANADRSHVVAELVARKGERHVVAGDLSGCSVGDTVAITAEPVDHPRFGRQLRLLSVRWVPPSTEEGMRRFLSGGSVKGVGPVLAGRIVGHFGLKTLDILNEAPERLKEVPRIGRKRVRVIIEAWKRARALNEEKAFLAGLGLGPGMSARVQRVLGEETAQKVRTDPWVLAREVEGIGFKRADEIARRLDVPSDAPARIEAGLAFTLAELADEGHCYAPRSRLVELAGQLLGLPPGPVEDALATLLKDRQLVAEAVAGEGSDSAIFLPRLHAAEKELAESLSRRLGELPAAQRVDAQRALAWAEPRLGIALTEDQGAALRLLFNARTGVLTGGPGVGKTTIVRALVEVFERKKLRVALAAPTGRAARRLAEACGRPAVTIHRLLKFNPRRGRFDHGRENPLEVEVLVVDEASMIDLLLMRDLLRALPATARFIVVGDADQLPSVGPGDVLRSLVDGGVLPVARLTKILRQREGSTIVHAAHDVLDGQVPAFAPGGGEGAFFIERDNAVAARDTIVQLVAERLPRRFGLDPLRDIQVLSPMNRGPLGVGELNEALKQALRSDPAAASGPGPGDRVLQTRNNYDLEVMNGEIGFVVARDAKSGELTVDFEDRQVKYPATGVPELALAYAITVHKSQGCEFPAVVLTLSMQHFVLLRRNLLYTAITRARRVLVVVGAPRALRTAVELGQVERRKSLLEARLRAGR